MSCSGSHEVPGSNLGHGTNILIVSAQKFTHLTRAANNYIECLPIGRKGGKDRLATALIQPMLKK